MWSAEHFSTPESSLKVQNRSSHANVDLKPLLYFARVRAGRLAEMARVEFMDSKPGETCYGHASMHGPHGTPSTPSLVRVWLSEDRPSNYPLRQRHVPELAEVHLRSWTEEALLVIAHELRHIVQFWEGENEDPHLMEVDAEAFAIETLNAWRQETAKVKPLKSVSSTQKAA